MIKVFLYDILDIDINYSLPSSVLTHVKNYREQQKNISKSNYVKLAKHLNSISKSITDLYFVDNKPHLNDCYLSISHSKTYYGFCLSSTHEIGFDLETISRFNEKKHLRLLNDHEKEQYQKCDNKEEFLALCWCQKEASGKLIGKGLHKSVLSFNIKEKFVHVFDDNIFVITANSLIDCVEFYLNDKLIKCFN